MKDLFLCELERLWSRKSVWLCFLAIPIILYGTAKYQLGVNTNTLENSYLFTSFGNFPILALQEQLILSFNLVVIFIVTMSITEEYRSGELRMVMIRPVKFSNIFIAKFLVLVATISLYLIIYFLLSVVIGYLLFPTLNNIAIVYHNNFFSISESLIYGVKFYLIGLCTLIAISSVIFFISIISKSVVIALGANIGFILVSFMGLNIIKMFLEDKSLAFRISLVSIPNIQFQGISAMLSGFRNISLEVFLILIFYTLVFFGLSYFIFSRRDKLI